MRKQTSMLIASALFLLVPGLFAVRARAQDISSVSGSVAAQSSDTTGLDSQYAEGAGDLGNTSHVDVTDATHSDILAGSMSPLISGEAGGSVNAGSDSQASRQDALQLSVSNAGGSHSSGGGNAFNDDGGFSAAASSQGDGFDKGAGIAAFRPSLAGGRSGSRGGNKGAAGLAAAGLAAMTPEGNHEDAAAEADPVLLPVNADEGLGSIESSIGTVETPTAEAGGFFMTLSPEAVAHQFDDGVTPVLSPPMQPGRMLPLGTQYSSPQKGFSDSTQGEAGLPLITAEIHAPDGLKTTSDTGLPSGSEGPTFEPKTGLVPDLYAVPQQNARAAFREQQDRIFEQNVVNGMDVADAEKMRRLALSAYSSTSRHHLKSRRSPLDVQSPGNMQSGISDTAADAQIR